MIAFILMYTVQHTNEIRNILTICTILRLKVYKQILISTLLTQSCGCVIWDPSYKTFVSL